MQDPSGTWLWSQLTDARLFYEVPAGTVLQLEAQPKLAQLPGFGGVIRAYLPQPIGNARPGWYYVAPFAVLSEAETTALVKPRATPRQIELPTEYVEIKLPRLSPWFAVTVALLAAGGATLLARASNGSSRSAPRLVARPPSRAAWGNPIGPAALARLR